MKHIISFSAIITTAVLLLSCSKDTSRVLQTEDVRDKAFIKIVNTYMAVNPSGATPAAGPSVDIFVNNAKINQAPIGFTSIFPAPTFYAAVTSGLSVNIKFVINRTGGSLPADTISNKDYNLAAGSYTTLFVADTTPNPTPQNPYILPFGESITPVKANFYRVRFVNMIPSGDTLEIFSKALNTVLLPGTRFKFASEWFEYPLLRRADTLQVRRVGTTTVLTDLKTWNPGSEHVYTLFTRGDILIAPPASGTVPVRARQLTFYTNR